MNRYVRAAYSVPFGLLKMGWTKLFHPLGFKGSFFSMISPLTEITLDRYATLKIGKGFKMQSGAKIRVRNDSSLIIGDNVYVNHGCIITCHDNIHIGSNVQFSPNVLVYDHDHDFRAPEGIKSNKYSTAPISIGDNVWIGANSVILRGTIIGDNCVIAAGYVIKGEYLSNTVIIQKRETQMLSYLNHKANN